MNPCIPFPYAHTRVLQQRYALKVCPDFVNRASSRESQDTLSSAVAAGAAGLTFASRFVGAKSPKDIVVINRRDRSSLLYLLLLCQTPPPAHRNFRFRVRLTL